MDDIQKILAIAEIFFIFCIITFWYFNLIHRGIKKLFSGNKKGIFRIILKIPLAILYIIILTSLFALLSLTSIGIIVLEGPVFFIMIIMGLIIGLACLAMAIGTVIFGAICVGLLFINIYEWLASIFH
jgi:hypothetical protein